MAQVVESALACDPGGIELPQELQSLLAYWLQMSAGKAMPDRRRMPLQKLDRWLDNLAIIVPAHYGALRRYEFAFSSQGLTGRFGCDAMRMSLRDLERPVWSGLIDTLDKALKGPAIGAFTAISRSGVRTEFQDLVLPLSDGRVLAAQFLMASYPVRPGC